MSAFSGEAPRVDLHRPVLRRVLMESLPLWTWLAAGLLTLGLTAWLVERGLLRPLAALAHTARQIAAGDLEFTLPDSRVQEVAEVGAAFTAMGAALREALERQAEMEQERRLLISGLAHDLRTPLFALRAHLEGLERGLARTPEQAARYLAVCRQQAEALEQRISDLFTYARLEYLAEVPRREPVDLGELLLRAVDGVAARAETRGVRVEVAGPGEPCPILADPGLLLRAVENLLDNALRHTPPGGEIRVEWRGLREQVVFRVADTGPGIDPGDLPHLFQPLYRGTPPAAGAPAVRAWASPLPGASSGPTAARSPRPTHRRGVRSSPGPCPWATRPAGDRRPGRFSALPGTEDHRPPREGTAGVVYRSGLLRGPRADHGAVPSAVRGPVRLPLTSRRLCRHWIGPPVASA